MRIRMRTDDTRHGVCATRLPRAPHGPSLHNRARAAQSIGTNGLVGFDTLPGRLA
jgi:hypothetical protein